MAIDTLAFENVSSQGDVIIDSFIFAGDDRLIQEVWSAGRHVVIAGRHFAHEQITCAYHGVLSDLRDQL